MAKSDAYETALLGLVLNGADYTGIATAVAGPLYVSLHTADPGEAGDQTTSEAAYVDYARVAVARDGTAWTVSGNTATAAAEVTFPAAGAGTTQETATHFAIGTASTGVGSLVYIGTLSPAITIGEGTTPRLTTATTVTED